MNIVIVDDEEFIGEYLEETVLEIMPQAQVAVFNDSTQARDYLAKNNPDLLITDYSMPEIKGSELCRLFLERSPKAKVESAIIITGYSGTAEEDLKAFGIEGRVTIFAKPVDHEKLIRVLQKNA